VKNKKKSFVVTNQAFCRCHIYLTAFIIYLSWKRILIDDRKSLAAAWTAKGGIFIHHKNTEMTLRLLQKYGVPVGEQVMHQSTIVHK
jgi:hypothetical protein